MQSYKYVGYVIATMLLGHLYNKYENNRVRNENNHIINKYLLNKNNKVIGKNIDKPIIWIHIKHEYNSREWLSFGSRSSYDLNMNYVNLTIKSIINKNPEYHICLIDDLSFAHILPQWNINMEQISEPQKEKMRSLGLLHILYEYGGYVIPSSFLCLRPLNTLILNRNSPYVIENINKSNLEQINFLPDLSFMYSPKQHPTIRDLINTIQEIISSDYTSESIFTKQINQYCATLITENKLGLISGNMVGTKNLKQKPIYLENLFGDKQLSIDVNELYGIYIPQDELLQRKQFNWFCYLDEQEIYKTNAIISKYFILAAN